MKHGGALSNVVKDEVVKAKKIKTPADEFKLDVKQYKMQDILPEPTEEEKTAEAELVNKSALRDFS